MMSNNMSISIKCCIIGSVNVGKTSIIQKYMTKKNINTETTLGAIYWLYNHETDNGISYKIDFWDTAGQERYHSLIPMYSRNSDIIILTFDITNRDSFQDLDKWLDIIQNHNHNYKIILVGNKLDLDFYRKIEKNEIQTFINNYKSLDIYYLELSAKTGDNLNLLFDKILELANQKIKVRGVLEKHNKLNLMIPKSINAERGNSYKCCDLI